MQTDTPVVIPLVDGARLIIAREQLSIADRAGVVMARIPLRDVSAVQRGGRDIIVTRRDHDPVAVTVASVDDAQYVLHLLGQQIALPSAPRRWRRQR